MFYRIVLSTLHTAAGNVLCLIQGVQFKSLDDQILLNDCECPILEMNKAVFSTSGSNIRRVVS